MRLFNVDFRSKDLEFLTKKNKQIIKASDLYAKIKDNTLTDFDPLEEAFKYLSNEDGELDIELLNSIYEKIDEP